MTSSTTPGDTAPSSPSRAAQLGLTAPHVAGGALASVTAALAASRLGVGGTLIGAAVGSVVSTIGGALYAHSLDRAGQRVITTRQRLIRPATGTDLSDPVALPPELDARSGVVAEGTSTEVPTEHPSEPAADPPPGRRARRDAPARQRPSWKVLVAAGVGLFVLTMGVITGLEFLLGHPVSDSNSSGTTVQRAVDPAPDVEPSVTPSADENSPAPTASADATESVPADASPTASPIEASPSPTAAEVPVESPAAPSAVPTDQVPELSPAPAAS